MDAEKVSEEEEPKSEGLGTLNSPEGGGIQRGIINSIIAVYTKWRIHLWNTIARKRKIFQEKIFFFVCAEMVWVANFVEFCGCDVKVCGVC
jgi:hypothetical protein